MPQTLTDVLGASASVASGILSVDLSEMVDENDAVLLADIPNATDNMIVAAIIKHLHVKTKPAVDGSGNVIVDKTNATVAQESFTPKTFEVREDETQIKHEFIFAVYTTDSNTFDPDNAVS